MTQTKTKPHLVSLAYCLNQANTLVVSKIILVNNYYYYSPIFRVSDQTNENQNQSDRHLNSPHLIFCLQASLTKAYTV